VEGVGEKKKKKKKKVKEEGMQKWGIEHQEKGPSLILVNGS